MNNLLNLLTDFALDTKKQTAFLSNSQPFFDSNVLSELERAALLSGKESKIAALFSENFVPLAVTAIDPGPDPLPDPDPFPPSDSED